MAMTYESGGSTAWRDASGAFWICPTSMRNDWIIEIPEKSTPSSPNRGPQQRGRRGRPSLATKKRGAAP